MGTFLVVPAAYHLRPVAVFEGRGQIWGSKEGVPGTAIGPAGIEEKTMIDESVSDEMLLALKDVVRYMDHPDIQEAGAIMAYPPSFVAKRLHELIAKAEGLEKP